MDTTPKYIKMCEKAEEIQKVRPQGWTRIHIKGNICYISYKDGGSFFYCQDTLEEEESTGNMLVVDSIGIWLPRQDQLQAMLWTSKKDIQAWFMIGELYNWMLKIETIKGHLDWSMEQLWLAFVMKEKFNKIWDDKEESWT